MKTSKQLERHLKGVANHGRIDILRLVEKQPGISVDGIAEKLNRNVKTASEHTRRLVQAGLLNKAYVGTMVSHSLSPYGKKILAFLETF